MPCLEFALLSRSPISLKKTPGRVAETKEEKREREAKRKTKHNNQQDLLASLSGEDTHTCRHAHTHTHLLPSLTNAVVFSELRRSLWKPGASFVHFIRSLPFLPPCVFLSLHTRTHTHNDIPPCPPPPAPPFTPSLLSGLKQNAGLKRL